MNAVAELEGRIKSLSGLPKLIASGALNVDHLHKVPQILTDGETRVLLLHREAGGSAANTTYALSKWGVRCIFVGCIGDDDDGKLLLQSFHEVGVMTQWVRVKLGAQTGRVLGFVDEHGKRALYVLAGANELISESDFPSQLPESVEWAHCTSLVGDKPMRTQLSWVMRLPQHVRVSFSPGAIYASLGIDTLHKFFERATVVFLTQDELFQLTGCYDIAKGVQVFHSLGTAIACVTMGAEGSIVSYKEDAILPIGIEPPVGGKVTSSCGLVLLRQEAIRANVVDTTGAGDAFAAGFLLGLLTKMPLDVCHRLATCAASICVERIGARSGMPSLNELIERYKASLPSER
ncbi:MAG: carbohydrate kinase family protein [Armatimonadetes bacterium]|nr:carbohydrate kinase family protein [Armatimonadota bacterium]